MQSRDRDIARCLKEGLLRERIPLVDLRVLGSRARGDARPDSDMDVCVVLEETSPAILRAIEDVAWEVGFDNGVIITTVEFTVDHLESSPLRASPLVCAIQSEGVPI